MPEPEFKVGRCQREASMRNKRSHLLWHSKDVLLTSSSSHQWKDFDLEASELRHAYQVMCSMVAEYECMETAAASFCSPVTLSDVELQVATSCGYNTGKLSAAATIQWLQAHYEEAEGISLPRGALYGHYLDFCQDTGMEAVNQATFGKIIRAVFVSVRTRRLGTRGQSKYHYYGLTIKDTSPYKNIMINTQRINNLPSGPGKPLHTRTVAQCSLPQSPSAGVLPSTSFGGGVLLQDFPVMNNVTVPAEIQEQTTVFLMMYKHHCQRIVDTVLRANFSEVKEFVVHFWQSLPSHISGVLTQQVIVDLVALCDTALYRAVCALLVPGLLQPLPASLAIAIRAFADDLVVWLQEALKSQPKLLRKKKLTVARTYSACLKRQTAVSHMASMARTFLHSGEMMRKLQDDWLHLNIDDFMLEARSALQLTDKRAHGLLQKYLAEFGRLLGLQTTIDRYMEWLKAIVNECVVKKCSKDEHASKGHWDIKCEGHLFLMQWTQASRIIIRDLTLDNAEMFGAYHLMSLLFQDYILHILEEQQREETLEKFRVTVYGEELANSLAYKKDDNMVIPPDDSLPASWTTTYPTPRNCTPSATKQAVAREMEPEFPAINLSHNLPTEPCHDSCGTRLSKDITIYRPGDLTAARDGPEMGYVMPSCSFADSLARRPITNVWTSKNQSNDLPHKPTSEMSWRTANHGNKGNGYKGYPSSAGKQVQSGSGDPHTWWTKNCNFSTNALPSSWTSSPVPHNEEYFSSVSLVPRDHDHVSGQFYQSPPHNYASSVFAEPAGNMTAKSILVSPGCINIGNNSDMSTMVDGSACIRPNQWDHNGQHSLMIKARLQSDINNFHSTVPRFPEYHHSSRLGSVNVA